MSNSSSASQTSCLLEGRSLDKGIVHASASGMDASLACRKTNEAQDVWAMTYIQP